jgi:hypothetical protein
MMQAKLGIYMTEKSVFEVLSGQIITIYVKSLSSNEEIKITGRVLAHHKPFVWLTVKNGTTTIQRILNEYNIREIIPAQAPTQDQFQ